MSVERACTIFRATDARWYMELGDFEHAHEPADCSRYGPFATEDEAVDALDHFSNPGSLWIDQSGTAPPPRDATDPRRRRYR